MVRVNNITTVAIISVKPIINIIRKKFFIFSLVISYKSHRAAHGCSAMYRRYPARKAGGRFVPRASHGVIHVTPLRGCAKRQRVTNPLSVGRGGRG
jgi:hypothetical protein